MRGLFWISAALLAWTQAGYGVLLAALRRAGAPTEAPWAHHVYHLYVVRVPDRDAVQRALAEAGIGTLIHYPLPAHLQPAYAYLGLGVGALPTTERLAREILSLPLYPGITPQKQERVVDELRAALR